MITLGKGKNWQQFKKLPSLPLKTGVCVKSWSINCPKAIKRAEWIADVFFWLETSRRVIRLALGKSLPSLSFLISSISTIENIDLTLSGHVFLDFTVVVSVRQNTLVRCKSPAIFGIFQIVARTIVGSILGKIVAGRRLRAQLLKPGAPNIRSIELFQGAEKTLWLMSWKCVWKPKRRTHKKWVKKRKKGHLRSVGGQC